MSKERHYKKGQESKHRLNLIKKTMTNKVNLESSWKQRLLLEFDKDYMKDLSSFLKQELVKKKQIYPLSKDYFRALDLTPFDKVKVVIIGQDPYHGPKQAHGLCFSVALNISSPPSLMNIYKELHKDIGMPIPSHGCLESWSHQGVLLLNNTLTVERGLPASHRGKGWEIFTNKIIQLLNEEKENLIFFLWGKAAQEKGNAVDSARHLVLKSPHPSPFSAASGFFGCRHFSKANKYLESKGKTPIDWASLLKQT